MTAYVRNDLLRFCANRDEGSYQRYALTLLPQFCMRGDVDPRLQGIVIALFEFTGPKGAWIADFCNLINSAEGNVQLDTLLSGFMEYLEDDSRSDRPLYQVPALLHQICKIPLGDGTTAFSVGDLFAKGDVLIIQTVEQSSKVSDEADVTAGLLGAGLVSVLCTKIHQASQHAAAGSSAA